MPRRLYWLKMRDDFFGRLEIKRLRKMPGGDTLVLIYERLLLLSLKTDGILTFHGYEHDLAEELALDLDAFIHAGPRPDPRDRAEPVPAGGRSGNDGIRERQCRACATV